MSNNLSFGVKLIAVVVLTRFLTDLVPVRRGAFLLDENAPDAGGEADKENRVVVQKEPDTGNIETPDFILEVSRIFDTNDIIAIAVNLDHSVTAPLLDYKILCSILCLTVPARIVPSSLQENITLAIECRLHRGLLYLFGMGCTSVLVLRILFWSMIR